MYLPTVNCKPWFWQPPNKHPRNPPSKIGNSAFDAVRKYAIATGTETNLHEDEWKRESKHPHVLSLVNLSLFPTINMWTRVCQIGCVSPRIEKIWREVSFQKMCWFCWGVSLWHVSFRDGETQAILQSILDLLPSLQTPRKLPGFHQAAFRLRTVCDLATSMILFTRYLRQAAVVSHHQCLAHPGRMREPWRDSVHCITYVVHPHMPRNMVSQHVWFLQFLQLQLQQQQQQQQPTTNNQQPTTNNQQPTTNNQQPTTNNQQPTTNNQQPTTNNQQPTTNNQQPTTNNQQPTTNNQQPTTNNQQPTTNNNNNNNNHHHNDHPGCQSISSPAAPFSPTTIPSLAPCHSAQRPTGQ